MSEETSSQPEDTVSRSELTNLQEQLKATRMERDRQIFEKSEIVAKANAYAKERDDVRDSLAAMTAERDRLAAENAGASTKALETSRQLEAANRRADEAAAEVVRLRHAIATAPSSDPAVVLWSLISEKTRDGVAWVRGKIPRRQRGFALVRQDSLARDPDRLHGRAGDGRLHPLGRAQSHRAF